MFDLTTAVTIITAVMSGILSGIYFIFSNTIMKTLQEMEPAIGITVMQKINKVIINPSFILLFTGAPALSLYLVFTGWFGNIGDATIWLITGSTFVILGNLLITATVNVPLNNELEAVDPNSENGKRVWEKYLSRWVTFNTLRSYTIATAATILVIAAVLL